MKTASQIQGDIYHLLVGSELSNMVTGDVYRDGYRPHDSSLEDVIVIFTTGNVAGIQSGVVTLNIYIPDIDPYGNGVMVQDGERSAELEAAAAQWVDSLTTDKSNYRFDLRQTIYTEADPNIKQHFVVVSLKYKYYE